jgi:hypothetical protein
VVYPIIPKNWTKITDILYEELHEFLCESQPALSTYYKSEQYFNIRDAEEHAFYIQYAFQDRKT